MVIPLAVEHPMTTPDLSMTAAMARAANTYGRVGPGFFLEAAVGLVREVDPKPQTRVLDVGCGPGIVASAMRRIGWSGQLVGVDVVPEMVHQTNRQLHAAPVEGSERWAVMDACDLAFVDETFDSVICAGAIYQMSDGLRAASEMLRVLRPGGTLGLSVFDGRDPAWSNLGDLYRRLVPPLPGGHPYDGAALAVLLERAGAAHIRLARRPLDVSFADSDEWLKSSWSHGERRAFEAMTEHDYRAFLKELPIALEPARGRDGRLHWRPTAVYARSTRP